MFTIRSYRRLTLLLAAAALLLPGCLERKETIEIDSDGSVRMRVELAGNPGDFATGDALPDKRSGWKTQDQLETDDDGDQTQKRIATRQLAPGEPLPDAYVNRDNPQYGIALMFPTTLEIEQREDGTYYHFKRVYHARAHARYEIWREWAKEKFDDVDKYLDMDPDNLTDEQRARLIEILRTQEAAKRVEYVAAGAVALEDVWPQHYGLLLRKALFDYFDSADVGPLAELLAQPDTPERNAAIDEIGERILGGAREALLETMRELHVPHDQTELFLAAHDEEKARRAVTEDIEDDAWGVLVKMPGEIVAHNGEQVDEENGVRWAFGGKVIYDRDHALMVTSRVPRGDRRAPRPD